MYIHIQGWMKGGGLGHGMKNRNIGIGQDVSWISNGFYSLQAIVYCAVNIPNL